MRLIDADALLIFLDDEMFKDSFRDTMKIIVNNQQTAYDVEKVVEQLEEMSDDIPMQYENNYEQGVDDGIEKAIDIVKQGCVGTDDAIDEDLRLKYCYEDLSDAEHRGYVEGYNKAIDDAKNVILQSLGNEQIINTLHLRLEQLKEGETDE